MPDSAVRVEGVVKRFGRTTALAGVDLDVEQATVFGLLGPERRRQDDPHSGAGHAARSGRRSGRGVWPRRRPRRRGGAGAVGADRPVRRGRRDAHRAGEPPDVRAAVRPLGRGCSPAGERAARALRAGRCRRPPSAHVLRWDAATARPRIEPAHPPAVLFLDEPTTGLDPRSRNEIWSVVRELVREGTTLLLTTQYLEEADQLAEQIAVIDHGRVIAQGTGSELEGSGRWADPERSSW